MRHLIYLIDGTWVFAGRLRGQSKHSNIYNLSNLLSFSDDQNNAQIIHYIRGLGATKGLRKYSSGGFGHAIKENVQDIYLNICANYREGDKIYVFGFSRGAVVARAVCGMLDFGILDPEQIEYLEDVWACYNFSSMIDQKLPMTSDMNRELEKSVSVTSRMITESQPEVVFLGLFDTVLGGRGMTRKLQELNILPGLVPKCVNNTFQIHALDETRPFFEPQPFKAKNPKAYRPQVLEQIWMPGVHTDIGGGYNNSGLAEISRLLMIDRLLEYTSLRFDEATLATLESKVLEDPKLSIYVNSEYSHNGFWFLRGLRTQRKVPRSMNFIHPITDELRNIYINFKGRQTMYEERNSSSNSRSAFFVSPKYKGRRMAKLGNRP